MKVKLALLLGSCLFLAACGTPAVSQNISMSSSSFDQTAAPQSGDPVAVMQTTKGTIKIRLFPKQAPETVKNFIELSKKGFYNGLIFHRVIPDFMIQGGDPLGNGTGGETYKGPGTTLPDEFSLDLKNIRGALSMANRGPNTGSSQFFIVQAQQGTPWLDGHHPVFGQVYEGLDVVDAIVKVPRNADDKPLTPVKIEKITIQE